ncbi:MAG: serine protein kinase RIO [Nitrosomonas sp.]|nr:MAG: serine protein kinase RIO [Nitrosomonas sp.]
MKIPERLRPLLEEGLIDEVICQLMSGKEAAVYMVRCGGEIRCTKVYKDGCKLRGCRRERLLVRPDYYDCGARQGSRQEIEAGMLCRLAMAGVTVPRFYNLFAGVLLMELITDPLGYVAPQLSSVALTPMQAREYHKILIDQIVCMLGAGIVHGDLSPYNVLIGEQGLVIIDLPQAINADTDYQARYIIKRDIDHLTAYFSRFAPELAQSDYASEIWTYYQRGKLNMPPIPYSGRANRLKIVSRHFAGLN